MNDDTKKIFEAYNSQHNENVMNTDPYDGPSSELDNDPEWDKFENESMDHHQEVIEKKYGKNVKVNLGWGVDSDPEVGISIASKVYFKNKILVLTTNRRIGSDEYDDTWSAY